MYMSVMDVCERLKINRSTVLRLIQTGKLSAIKLARKWRVSEDSLAQYLAAQQQAGAGK